MRLDAYLEHYIGSFLAKLRYFWARSTDWDLNLIIMPKIWY